MSLLTPNWLDVLPGRRCRMIRTGSPPGRPSRTGSASTRARSRHPSSSRRRRPRHASAGWPLRRPHERGTWSTANVVVATGDCDLPRVPAVTRATPAGLVQLHVTGYRRPELLPPGGVLVVGAGPSGQQVARELCRAGRDVVLCVGRHARAPRRYRGEDIWYWLEAIGSLDTSDRRDPRRAHRADGAEHPADGLVRRRRHRPRTAQPRGRDSDRTSARLRRPARPLRGRPPRPCATPTPAGSLTLGRSTRRSSGTPRPACRRPRSSRSSCPTRLSASTPRAVESARSSGRPATGAATTGCRCRASAAGRELLQHHGVSPVRGVYTMGIRFQSRRSSHFIGGVAQDAAALATAVTGRDKSRRARAAASRAALRSRPTDLPHPGGRRPVERAGGGPTRQASTPSNPGPARPRSSTARARRGGSSRPQARRRPPRPSAAP